MPESDFHSGREVFEILVREHSDMLMSYARSLMQSTAAAEDLFQQTMLVAWKRLSDFDRTRPFGPWLRGIAQNVAFETRRKNSRSVYTTDPAVLSELDQRFEAVNKMEGDTFISRASRISQCIEQLPEHMQEPINLLYVRGMLITSIAASLSASEEAIKKRIQRARQLLADCIVKQEAQL